MNLDNKVPFGDGASQYHYIDVGLQISASLSAHDHSLELFSQVDKSGVADPSDTTGSQHPVIRRSSLRNTSLVTVGKKVVIGSLDEQGSTRRLDIEVELEPVP